MKPECLRILITTGIFPPDIGGPATQIERLATDLACRQTGLSRDGNIISVLTYGAPAKKARNFALHAVSKKWPSSLRQIIFLATTFWLARRADIVYTTDLYAPGYCSMLAAKFWHKKFVVRFAGDSAWESAQNLGLTQDDILTFQTTKYNLFVEKRKKQRAKILQSADGVVAVSNFMKELAILIGVQPEKIKVIYNAVDFFGSVPTRRRPAVPTLVYSGRITPWKGVEMLIRVVADLKQKYPDIIFEILGDGSEFEKLKNLAEELGVKEQVKFRGRVSEEESHQIFAHSTIFVLNTNYEGLSHAVLNAMNVGLPVITTPVGGNPEVIVNEENGLLVPYNDQKAWESAITKLLFDIDLQEKFIQKAKKILEEFRWEKLIVQTENFLKSLCTG